MAEGLMVSERKEDTSLSSQLLEEEFLWACTTCGHCLDVCPAFIRPPEQVIDIRRAQVLMTGEMPQTVGETLRNFERQGPDRTEWPGLKALIRKYSLLGMR